MSINSAHSPRNSPSMFSDGMFAIVRRSAGKFRSCISHCREGRKREWSPGTRRRSPLRLHYRRRRYVRQAAIAEHLWFRSTGRSERILVLEAGPFVLAEHMQNLPSLGLSAGASSNHEVWGLPWNSDRLLGYADSGLAYCVGGRSLWWAAGRRACSIPKPKHPGRPRCSMT